MLGREAGREFPSELRQGYLKSFTTNSSHALQRPYKIKSSKLNWQISRLESTPSLGLWLPAC